MTKLKNEDYYLTQLKGAKTKEEISNISYTYLRDEDTTGFSKDYYLIVRLCCYKDFINEGISKEELEECRQEYKLPKTLIKKIT